MDAYPVKHTPEVSGEHPTGLSDRLARLEQRALARGQRGAATPAAGALPIEVTARKRCVVTEPAPAQSAASDDTVGHSLVIQGAGRPADAAAPPSPLIVKSNRLIEASYQLTLAEQRVLLCVVAQIDRHPDAVPVTAQTPFAVTARGLAELFGIPNKQAYELMMHGCERLAERWIVIDAPDAENPRLTKTKTRWVHKLDYLPAEGTLRLYLAPEVIPYLTHIASEFTRYKVTSVARITTPYAFRLYELLLQWLPRGERDITLAWLKHAFDLSGEYSRLGNLKARIIMPAVSQINAYSNLNVSWTQNKKGRAVVGFTFYFELKNEGAPHPVVSLSREDIVAKAQPGETWEQARTRLSRERRSERPVSVDTRNL
ncbi:replication initiation protein [uncultured Thiodictyon sp.]|uniref:replication initiation protein n=1 Tax=uncultured Thiodictyon sp. TaxID=1846217 RepID=UPI0025F7457F|nr:replication initiation protein [uncultured Thiodictyon sp.]